MKAPAPKPLQGRCAIVSGASRGLGFEVARHYLEAGASVMLCAREEKLLDESCSALRQVAGPGQAVLARRADVSSSGDVDALVAAALGEFGRLDILVNNAGIAGPCGRLESIDWPQWIRTLEINLFGSVLLSRAVLPHFKRAGRGKIIQLSGGGATKPMPMQSAYAASKAAVVRFMETLAEETREHRIDVNAIAPGALNTRMLDEALAAGQENLGPANYRRLLEQKRDGGVPLAEGAKLAVFLGSAASDGITGKLLSAAWDSWQDLPKHLAELSRSDVYTLRRILPGDRGMAWEDA